MKKAYSAHIVLKKNIKLKKAAIKIIATTKKLKNGILTENEKTLSPVVVAIELVPTMSILSIKFDHIRVSKLAGWRLLKSLLANYNALIRTCQISRLLAATFSDSTQHKVIEFD